MNIKRLHKMIFCKYLLLLHNIPRIININEIIMKKTQEDSLEDATLTRIIKSRLIKSDFANALEDSR